MKKIITLFLLVFLAVGTFGFVMAEDSEKINIPEAREVGFFEGMFDGIGFAFTFNKEHKLERALELAEKRLAEVEYFAEEYPEKAEVAREKYNKFIVDAEKALAGIEDSKVKDVDGSIRNIENVVRAQNKFEWHREHIGEIYLRALHRFEGNNASDEKIERFEKLYEKALNRSEGMEKKIFEKKEQIMKRHKILSEKSDEELNEILVSIEDKEGLVVAREKRIERAQVRVQKFVEIKNREVLKAQARLDNSNLTEDQKQLVEKKIRLANERVHNFEDNADKRIEVEKRLVQARARRADNFEEEVVREIKNRELSLTE